LARVASHSRLTIKSSPCWIGTPPAALVTNAEKYAEVVGALAGTCAERR
jgi:hypothetical protein